MIVDDCATCHGTRVMKAWLRGRDGRVRASVFVACTACLLRHPPPPRTEDLIALLHDAIRPHYHCEDSWYCCALCTSQDHGVGPRDSLDGHDGEAPRTAGVCNCGAEAWNARVRDMIARLENNAGT